MNKYLRLLGTVFLTAAAVSAAPACTTVLGTDVVAIGAGGGCTYGAYLFSNFQVLDANPPNGGGPILLIGVANPQPSTYNLTFDPQLNGPLFPQDLHLMFQV